MTLLPIVTRELLVLARHKNTHRVRVAAAILTFLSMLWLVTNTAGQTPVAEQGQKLFSILSTVAFIYALFVGPFTTSDCLSYEKREGTLGLLFLTDLRGYDVVLGKLASSSLNAAFALVAIVPIMALAFLLGGITTAQFARVGWVILHTLLFSLSVGVLVSTISRSERRALFASLLTILLVTFGPYALATSYAPAGVMGPLWQISPDLLMASPYFAFELTRPNFVGTLPLPLEFQATLRALGWMTLSFLALASVLLPGLSREGAESTLMQRLRRVAAAWTFGDSKTRAANRRALLDRNAFFWLAARDVRKHQHVWLFVLALSAVWGWCWLRYPNFILDWAPTFLFILFMHAFIKVWFTSEVCSRFVEDRRSGAFELLLTTPFGVKEIAKGQGLALVRQFLKPLTVVVILDGALMTAGVLWFSRKSAPETYFMAIVAAVVMLIADLAALRWVAMWQSLTARSINRALVASLVRVMVLPSLLFVFIWWTAVFWQSLRHGQFFGYSLGFVIQIWFVAGIVADLWFGMRARRWFLDRFREMASSQFTSAPEAISAPAKDSGAKPEAVREAPSRFRGWRRRIALVGSGMILVAGVMWYWSYSSAIRAVGKKLSAMAQAGYPTNELQRSQLALAGPSENAVVAFVRTIPLHVPPLKVSTNYPTAPRIRLPRPAERLTAEMREGLRQIVSSNAVPLQMLHEACSMKMAVFDGVQPNNHFQFVQFHHGLELLHLEAWHRIESSDPDDASKPILALLNLAEAFQHDASLIGQHRRNQILLMAISQLERLFSLHTPSPAVLETFLSKLRQAEDRSGWRKAFIGGLLDGFDFHRMSSTELLRQRGVRGGMEATRLTTVHAWRKLTGRRDRDFLSYLEKVEQVVAWTKQPFPEAMNSLHPPTYDGESWINFNQFIQSMNHSCHMQAELCSRLRAAQAAVQVELRRQAQAGALPDGIDGEEARSPWPADPIDGQPIRFRRLKEGYLVYGIGLDKTDDQGLPVEKPNSPNRRSEYRDVIFQVAR
jgi:ABC-type transport system involved in multi-copper enzyme maturation permease subunit